LLRDIGVGPGSIAGAITTSSEAAQWINSTLTSIEAFERTIIWPQVLIDRARAAVGSIQGIFRNIRALGQVGVASATLPTPRQLEQTFVSGRPRSVQRQPAHAVYSVPLPTTPAAGARSTI
jgi:hypothetical protein